MAVGRIPAACKRAAGMARRNVRSHRSGGLSSLCLGFAVRGLGTPAPIAPTKFLVVSALHRYVRNPMYASVAVVIVDAAALFRAPYLLVYAGVMLTIAHLFVVSYEEPVLRRQFGESYEQYRRTVPRWIPKFHASSGTKEFPAK